MLAKVSLILQFVPLDFQELMAKIFLRKKISDRIQKGHNWIFQNEIGDIEGHVASGDLVSVYSSNGSFVGKGQYNAVASIAIRLFCRNLDEAIDESWLLNHLKLSKVRKEYISVQLDSFRWVYDEIDGLGGLIIDLYQKNICVTILTKFWELRKEWILNSLVQLGFERASIYFDNSNKLRKFEGLNVEPAPVIHNLNVIISEHKIRLDYFHEWTLDRRNIREWLAKNAKDKVLWDLFSGMGSLSLVALKNHAKSVYAVDQLMNDYCIKELNEFPNFHYFQANVFDWLNNPKAESPDLIILDCPTFNLSKDNGYSSYIKLIVDSLKLVNRYGIVIFGKSSSKMNENVMQEILQDIYQRSEVGFSCNTIINMPEDFGSHPLYPHLNYLQYYIFQKIG